MRKEPKPLKITTHDQAMVMKMPGGPGRNAYIWVGPADGVPGNCLAHVSVAKVVGWLERAGVVKRVAKKRKRPKRSGGR